MKRILLLAAISLPCLSAELIFEETFDDQPDWHSGLLANALNPYGMNDSRYFPDAPVDTGQSIRTTEWAPQGHIIPQGFFSIRQAGQNYSPRSGYADHHENIEILAENSDKARGKQGKSAVFWREPTQDNDHFWMTDSILTVYLPNAVAGSNVFDAKTHQGLNEVYYEYWITFDDDTTVYPNGDFSKHNSDMSKISRVSSFDERGSEFRGFSGGDKGPTVIYGWATNQYGVRNGVTVRGGPHGHGYSFGYGGIDFPHPNGSMNYLEMVEGQSLNGTTERPVNLQNGEEISEYPAEHSEVFGNEHTWVKVAFYVKMNSAPDVEDGVLIQWLNGRRLLTLNNIPYIRSERIDNDNQDYLIEPSGMVKWNLVAIGGNDYFHSHPKESMREEWVAIDDLRIYNGLPEHADVDINDFTLPPKSPTNFSATRL